MLFCVIDSNRACQNAPLILYRKKSQLFVSLNAETNTGTCFVLFWALLQTKSINFYSAAFMLIMQEKYARFILRIFFFSASCCKLFVLLVLRLLVGAPRAKALNRQTSIITGGLYKCDITQSTGCERVQFDNEGEEPYPHVPNYQSNLSKYIQFICYFFQRGHTT